PRAVLAFLPEGGDDNPDPVLDRLAARPQLALGLTSATQGRYTAAQSLLDISAGSRTSPNVYDPRPAPRLELVAGGDGTGFVFGWAKALARARTALAQIHPGLLAQQIPGGAGYAGVRGRQHLEAAAAADAAGDVAAVSLGPAASLGDRVERLLRRHRLVVAGLPTAAKGDAVLDRLLRDHRRGDVLIVMQTRARSYVPQLLPIGALLGDGARGLLTSPTTRTDGIVAGIDIPATILRTLRLAVPSGVKGQPMRAEGTANADDLRAIEARLKVVGGRRTPTLLALLFSWASLTLALGLIADRRGVRAGVRIGALAVLWVLPMLLVTGALAPPRLVEVTTVVGGSFALAALTDRFVPWPRGPLVPAAVAVVGYGIDLVAGSGLIVHSLLGPNPRSGGRFYGLGNELESSLAVLLLVALGTALTRRADFDGPPAPFGRGPGRSRRGAAIVAIGGVVAAILFGAGQFGADVGGVITVGAGIAVMTVLMLPGRPSRRTVVLAALAPFVALAGLALLDLASGGNGHFTRSVLKADSVGALWDVVVRRYTLAFNVLRTGAMPFIVVLALLSVAYAARYRERIYAPLRGSPAWRALLAGGLASAVVGALFNDSGPILLIFGVFVLACLTAYARADPNAR
ncbi:MAG: hypothetical protein QOG94_694, partial [Solirubrobacteraceae bacterium]|nr:hypothetical protein [Solirubrobacteraceae bacterium]